MNIPLNTGLENAVNGSTIFSNYPDIINTKQLQSMLGLSKNSILDLLRTGEIRSFRRGRKYIIPKICVIDYVMAKIG